jgi:hypothetical protein
MPPRLWPAALTVALLAAVPPAFGDTLHRSGSPADKLDLVILADGYRASQRAEFERAARRVWEELRTTEPFSRDLSLLNVHTGFRPSPQSGAREDSAYGTRFMTSFGTRLRAQRLTLLLGDAVRAGGEADAVLVIVRSNRRGGTATGHIGYVSSGAGPAVAIHELGHMIGGLGDEYTKFGGSTPLTREQVSRLYPNLTTASTRAALPWADLVDPKTRVPAGFFTRGISAYRGGGAYSSGIYRPERSCRMRADHKGFCAVCRQHLAIGIRAQGRPTSASAGGRPGRVVGVTSRLRVRAGASTATAILGHLAPNASVRVTGPARDGFYPIAFNGGTGYVGARFVRLNAAGVTQVAAALSQ